MIAEREETNHAKNLADGACADSRHWNWFGDLGPLGEGGGTL
jgi:hypothetical protein